MHRVIAKRRRYLNIVHKQHKLISLSVYLLQALRQGLSALAELLLLYVTLSTRVVGELNSVPVAQDELFALNGGDVATSFLALIVIDDRSDGTRRVIVC